MSFTDSKPTAVVGIGASAGGLQSLEPILERLKTDGGLACVVVVHLAPDARSFLSEILGRHTAMKVLDAEEGMTIAANTVYVNVPGKELRLQDSRFVLNDLEEHYTARPVDEFFISLSRAFGEQAIGLILSGTGSDGTNGLREIRACGGMTVVESPRTAQFDGMPLSAISAGCVDYVLPREKIPEAIHNRLDGEPCAPPNHDGDHPQINSVFELLSARHGIDFSQYKPSTIIRRMERRLRAREAGTLQEYVGMLARDFTELDALYSDLLIGVTEFFRDEEAFAKLKMHLTKAVEDLEADEELRFWVAGCATGEEVFTLAIIAHECFAACNREVRLKVLATDVHENALAHASKGLYHRDHLQRLSAERIMRFFTPEGPQHLRISGELRRHVIFSRHNVIEDPPFTRLHLVSCRNMLIYLNSRSQRVALASFHFALQSHGLLFLGSSEVPTQMEQAFDSVDLGAHLYRKSPNQPPLIGESPILPKRSLETSPLSVADETDFESHQPSFSRLLEAYEILLDHFIGDGVFVNSNQAVIHVFGNAHRFLVSESGRFSENLSQRLPQNLRGFFAAALLRASSSGECIRLRDVEFPDEQIDVTVRALRRDPSAECLWLIEFGQPTPKNDLEVKEYPVGSLGEDHEAMAAELTYTRETLHATIEELEASNEELQSTNQELIASNQELQSINEKLQSVNEEFFTVNAENERRMTELRQAGDDWMQLLDASESGTILLDNELNIARFTPSTTHYFDLVPHDIGRPLSNFVHHVALPNLFELLEQVIVSRKPILKRARHTKGHPIAVKIAPFGQDEDDSRITLTFAPLPEIEES
ncbi:MAG: chemotaxis protein CheB [Planctomycetota bacterium]